MQEHSITSRSLTTWCVTGLLALVLLLTACGGGSTPSNAPSAQQLIKNAQAAI